MLGRLKEANAYWEEADALARRYGVGGGMLWSQMELTAMAITQGDLSTALVRADALLAATGDRDQVHNAARLFRIFLMPIWPRSRNVLANESLAAFVFKHRLDLLAKLRRFLMPVH